MQIRGILIALAFILPVLNPGSVLYAQEQQEDSLVRLDYGESAELLEIFQWSAEDVWCEEKKEKIREELADVLNYCILMADACGLDMDEIIQEKVRKNAEKYPVEKAYGSKEKYMELKE